MADSEVIRNNPTGQTLGYETWDKFWRVPTGQGLGPWLTISWNGRQLGVSALWSWVHPWAGILNCLEFLFLELFKSLHCRHVFPQLQADCQVTRWDRWVHNRSVVIQRRQISQTSPAVHVHFYSTVIVVGAAQGWRLTAAWWLATRTGLTHLGKEQRRSWTSEKKPGAQYPQWAPCLALSHASPHVTLLCHRISAWPGSMDNFPGEESRASPAAGETTVRSSGGWRGTKECSSKRLRGRCFLKKSGTCYLVQGILQQAVVYLTQDQSLRISKTTYFCPFYHIIRLADKLPRQVKTSFTVCKLPLTDKTDKQHKYLLYLH